MKTTPTTRKSREWPLTNTIVLFCLMFCVSDLSSQTSSNYPTLPTATINTSYSLPTSGATIIVNAGGNLQTAINNANYGDVIVLQANATFTGSFNLPNKTGTGWIYIVSSSLANLPPVCTRVNPTTDAINMPKIVTPGSNLSALYTSSNAHNYRFVGIEIKPAAGTFITNLIAIGATETNVATLPNNIIFDRCFIHGEPTLGARRGIMMNGASISVIDSYLSDFKEVGADSQALCAWSTPGPIKIVNNYLEGAGENVMFGGADPYIQNCVPSDIEIRNNYFFKPLGWITQNWVIKNLLEFKNGQRVIVEGNVLENNWGGQGQNGFGILVTPRNQNGTAPWTVVQDITFKCNKIKNSCSGVNISASDNNFPSQLTKRVLLKNNTFEITGLAVGVGSGMFFQILRGPEDIILDHNTAIITGSNSSKYGNSDNTPKADRFVFKNNIVSHSTYGFVGTATGDGLSTLTTFYNPNYTFTKNAIIGGVNSVLPANNFVPATNTVVGFVNFATGNYSLTAASPYKNAGTDGNDLGANIDSLNIALIYNCNTIITNIEGGTKNSSSTYQVFPIPANNELHINKIQNNTSDQVENITLVDLLGKTILNITTSSEHTVINTNEINSGIYFVKTKDFTKKVIIQH